MLRLLAVETRRGVQIALRYPLNTLVSILMTAGIFYAFFLGARYMAGSAMGFGGRLEGIIVGYVTWLLASNALMHPPHAIEEEAMTGTLESLFLSCYGVTTLFLMRTLAESLIQLVKCALILALIMALTGGRLTLSLSILFPLATLVATGMGMGLMGGGVALMVKRSRSIFAAVHYAYLLLLMTPFETWEGHWPALANLIPLVPGVSLLREIMVRGGAMDPVASAAAVLGAAFWLAAGILVFRRTVTVAKEKGLIAGY